MKSLKLDENWNIGLNEIGNLGFIEEKEDIAQTVACATRVFQGEYIFDNLKGIPYSLSILGGQPRNVDVSGYMQSEAEKIEGVKYAEITDIEFIDRVYKGNIQLTT